MKPHFLNNGVESKSCRDDGASLRIMYVLVGVLVVFPNWIMALFDLAFHELLDLAVLPLLVCGKPALYKLPWS